MPKTTLPKEMLQAVTDTTIDALKEMEWLYVSKHHEDARSAVKEGAVLLAIARVDNDEDGDGFRYLVGLQRGIKITSYLKHLFGI